MSLLMDDGGMRLSASFWSRIAPVWKSIRTYSRALISSAPAGVAATIAASSEIKREKRFMAFPALIRVWSVGRRTGSCKYLVADDLRVIIAEGLDPVQQGFGMPLVDQRT